LKNLKYWIPALLWMLLIFILSTSYFSAENTKETIPSAGGNLRHIAHIIEYFILTTFVYIGLSNGFKITTGKYFLLSTLISIFYSLTDEVHQYFVPGRNARWIDIGYDGMGVITALIGLLIVSKVVKGVNKSN